MADENVSLILTNRQAVILRSAFQSEGPAFAFPHARMKCRCFTFASRMTTYTKG